MNSRLLVILILSFLFSSCSNSSEVRDAETEIMQEDAEAVAMPILNVAIVPNTPDYYLKGYHAEGFYFNIIKGFKYSYKSFVNYVPCKNVTEAITLIKEGKCDIACIDNIMKTDQSFRHISFSPPIVNEKLVLVQSKNAKRFINTPTQFNGDTIFCSGNPTLEKYLTNLSKEIKGDFTPVSIDTLSDIELIKRLNSGKIKYGIISSRYADNFIRLFPHLDFSVAMSFSGERYWLYDNKNLFLKAKLPQWIEAINKTKKRTINNFAHAYNSKSNNISAYDNIIKEVAKTSKIDPYFVISLAYHESTFYTNLMSPKGAYGLLQLMPSTLEQYNIDTTASIKEQITVGVKFLEQLRSRYANKVKNEIDLYAFVLAAYNSGAGRVDQAVKLSKKNKLQKNVWWGNVELALKYIRREELISPDSTDDGYKGHHSYFFVRNVMESYNHFRNLKE